LRYYFANGACFLSTSTYSENHFAQQAKVDAERAWNEFLEASQAAALAKANRNFFQRAMETIGIVLEVELTAQKIRRQSWVASLAWA
jgi:hypothetical protein